MASTSCEASDSSEPVSTPGFKPFVTGAVSRPARGQDDSISAENYERLNDGYVSDEDEGHEFVGGKTEDKRPWYRKPSPWWMLTMMPISAMTLAGVNPSLYQVYTELVCRSVREGEPSRLALDTDGVQISPSSHLVVRDFFSLSPLNEHDHAANVFRQTESRVWIRSLESLEEPDCASDPVVQAAVSRLLTALLTSQGILSCITAASWASLSDRLGRRPILAMTSSAIIICYSIFIFVYYSSDHLPGGYWLLLFGPIIYGLLGGSAGTTAATNAYIADCTPVIDRAGMFSLTLGLRFTGMAIGPTLNSLLVRATGTPIAALALVVGTHVVYLLMMLFVVPESLSAEKRADNRRAWNEAREGAITVDTEGSSDYFIQQAKRVLLRLRRAALAFIRPLSIVGPIIVTQPSGRMHKDRSLTFIAISAGLASVILASYTSMFQFAAAMFGWSAVELGFWYSGIVAARAVTLTAILPIIIKVYHHFISRFPKDLSSTSHEDAEPSDTAPLLSSRDNSSVPSQRAPPSPSVSSSKQKQTEIQKTPAFDLRIAQLSLLLEVVCYALVPLFFAHNAIFYTILTILASCGAGFGPAIQALAIDLYAGRGGTETGRLFGMLSVVQTISSQILGPTIYGVTYMKIVSFYPEGIFFVSTAAVASAVAFLFFVELPDRKSAPARADTEATA